MYFRNVLNHSDSPIYTCIIVCRTGAIFCVFQASGGKHEASAERESRARVTDAPRSPEKCKKITLALQTICLITVLLYEAFQSPHQNRKNKWIPEIQNSIKVH